MNLPNERDRGDGGIPSQFDFKGSARRASSRAFPGETIMRTCVQLSACLFLSCVSMPGAESKSLLDVAPTVAELGEGWKLGTTTLLIDPLSRPAEIGPAELIKVTREMMKRTGREAYLRIALGHSAMTNHECQVYLQRWPSTDALNNHHYRKPDPLPGKAPPAVGQEGCWSGGPFVSSLSYRLDQYLIVIEGWTSDDARLLRLAKVIEAKLLEKSVPREISGSSSPAVAPPNAMPPHR